MKKLFLAAVSAALAALAGGCLFGQNDYVENAEFDLALPKRIATAGSVRMGVFKNLSGSDRRFLIRRDDGQVVPLEYQRWRLAPELLLQRCVYGAFEVAPDNDESRPRLNAVIYCFEFDEREKQACLAVDLILTNSYDAAAARPATARTVRAEIAVPVKDSGDLAAARAAAMSECARIAVEKLAPELAK